MSNSSGTVALRSSGSNTGPSRATPLTGVALGLAISLMLWALLLGTFFAIR